MPPADSHRLPAPPEVAPQPAATAQASRPAFKAAPPGLRSTAASLIEPLLAASAYLVTVLVLTGTPQRHDLVFAMFVMLLPIPGRDRSVQSPGAALRGILVSWSLWAGVLLLGVHLSDTLPLFDPLVLAVWAVAVPMIHIGAATLMRSLRRRAALSGAPERHAVVVGGGALAVRVASALRERDEAPVRILGHFDDRFDERLDPAARSLHLGRLDGLVEFIRLHRVSEVYVTLPLMSQPRIAGMLERLQATTASVFFVPDVLAAPVVQGRLQSLGGLPVLTLCDTPFTGMDALAKRASDLVIASLALMLLAPVLLGIAIGVKLSSPGPVIFRQRRNGLDGSEIVVWKFRSMRVQEDGAVVTQAQRGDSRVTPFGAFIRRTSLDELPQFFNVLQGRMSVVGPRPHAVAHNEQYRELIQAYPLRHKVRPGITGWAQVNGCRGETDTLDKMRRRVEYDIDYLRHWSPALDLLIVWRTLRVVLGDDAAY
jgi:putative colanic acid biosysnthesis UDP-glucose lipid carrier transferase